MKTALVIASRNRLQHLRRTVPSFLSQGSDHVIIVDMESTDGTQDWLRSLEIDRLTLAHCDNSEHSEFQRSMLLNTGSKIALEFGCDVLVHLDCDCIIDYTWLNECIEGMERINDCCGALMFRPIPKWKGSGDVVVPAEIYRKMNGSCEDIINWGFDDSDFRDRMCRLGTAYRYAREHIRHIYHGEERNHNHSRANKKIWKARTGYSANEGKTLDDLGWQGGITLS